MKRALYRQVEHLVDVLPVIANLQHFGLVPHALALFANQLHIGQKLHLDCHRAVALACLATAAGNVEGEMPGGVTALLALRLCREQLPNGIKRLDIRHRVRPRRSSDRRLIHQYDRVDPIGAFNLIYFGAYSPADLAFFAGQRVVQHIMHQRRFPRS